MHDFSTLDDNEKQLAALKGLAEFCTTVRLNADDLDKDGSFPEEDVVGLHKLGFLHAPLPVEAGGIGLASSTALLRQVLRLVGQSSLSLGRLYEGHVNAIRLVQLYGEPQHLDWLRSEADEGRLTGVWNAQDEKGLGLAKHEGGLILAGRKIWTSGARHVRMPLVTARRESDGGVVMILPRLDEAGRADISNWRALGMRASETGVVDFTGLVIDENQIVGQADDYYRSPHFSGGAWRVLAVQLGGLDALFSNFCNQIGSGARRETEHYRALIGRAGIALETARLWVVQASERMAVDADAIDLDAYVNLARTAFERCALDLIECVQRGLGLSAFLKGSAVDRVIRDLSTYLRQPFPDKALSQAVSRLLEKRSHVFNDEMPDGSQVTINRRS